MTYQNPSFINKADFNYINDGTGSFIYRKHKYYYRSNR